MFVRYTCADVNHCGRSFMAFDEFSGSITCPYCNEAAVRG